MQKLMLIFSCKKEGFDSCISNTNEQKINALLICADAISYAKYNKHLFTDCDECSVENTLLKFSDEESDVLKITYDIFGSLPESELSEVLTSLSNFDTNSALAMLDVYTISKNSKTRIINGSTFYLPEEPLPEGLKKKLLEFSIHSTPGIYSVIIDNEDLIVY